MVLNLTNYLIIKKYMSPSLEDFIFNLKFYRYVLIALLSDYVDFVMEILEIPI